MRRAQLSAALAQAQAPIVERIPLALYLHVPWCLRKCPYCDFNSHPLRGEVPAEAYVDALIRDLDFELATAPAAGRALSSIFIGGGTPSLMPGAAIGRLLQAVAARLPFAADIEITLEANPGAVDAGHFRDYRAAGVNRLSIGVQSFDETMLQRLGRVHDRQAAIEAFRVARAAGFDNVNLDLMFALPKQSLAEAVADLETALALAPEHLSYYQLTLEPNTEFARRPPALPDDDRAWAMQQEGLARLAAGGYARYEVSAYARRGRRARHNLNYWQFGDYLGIGAGAHGKRSSAAGVERRARHRHPRRYEQAAGSAAALQEVVQVASRDLPFEFAMNALRLDEGFALRDFEARTGLPAAQLSPVLADARRRGLVELDAGRVRATALGLQHLNSLLTLFLP